MAELFAVPLSTVRRLVPCPSSVTSLPLEEGPEEDDTKSKVPTKCYLELSRSFVVCLCTIGTIERPICPRVRQSWVVLDEYYCILNRTCRRSKLHVLTSSTSIGPLPSTATTLNQDQHIVWRGAAGTGIYKAPPHHQRFFLVGYEADFLGVVRNATAERRTRSGSHLTSHQPLVCSTGRSTKSII